MKKKKEVSGMRICSIVFGGIGISFLAAGIISFALISDPKVLIVSYIFGSVGAVFTVVAIILISLIRKKHNMQQRLKSEGQYVLADITKIFMNAGITYGNKHPYKIYCKYMDDSGVNHKFHSNNIMINPDGLIDDEQIRVYVNSNDYSRYYVDTDSIMTGEGQCIVEGKSLNRNKAYLVMGIMFVVLSLMPACIGILLYTRFFEVIILVITSILALPFFCIGMVFIVNEIRKKKIFKKCRENNQYVMARVAAVGRDPSVELSGIAGTAMLVDAIKNGSKGQAISTEAYYLQCVYQSGDNVKHVFRTGSFFRAPGEDIIGKEVKVYYYGPNMEKYFIDELPL